MRYRFAVVLACSFVVGLSLAAGAEKQKKPKKKGSSKQTKRIGQGQIQPTIDGKPEQAIAACERFLAGDPEHLESHYNLALAYAQQDNIPKAMEHVKKAVDGGLSIGRFWAGPRRLAQPLVESAEFLEFAKKHPIELLHGPMLGCVTDTGAKFWVRTVGEVPVQVLVSASKDLANPIKSKAVSTDADRDFTAVASVEGLKANTVYHYDVLIDGKSTQGESTPEFPTFKTFPPAGGKGKFSIGFGGGAGFTPQFERMWDTITSHKLLAFLFLGDNVYIDNPTRPDMQHYTYYRRQSRPEYSKFYARTPLFAIWDDHDFGTNDCFVTTKVDDPAWKIPVWKVFKNNWNNPGYGTEDNPGCYFKFAIGDVDFFMLDGRYYRTSPKISKPTMLGPEQKRWLLDSVKASKATFKVLCSPVPWVLNAKGNSLDTWRGFEAEREEIFSFLEANKIEGVVLLSADRHRSDVWRIDRKDGYPLFEFESSRLTNIHTHGKQPGCLFSYSAKCSFGQVTFDTTKADPELTYQIFNIDDELIHTFAVKKSQLQAK